ncbi:MAG: SpoIIE family protein phosphatase [Spirochaetes bacterium]|nr:SpoIIE family protein phosphatase [Spirochaetota bacterium]
MPSLEARSYLTLIIPMFIMALGFTVFFHNRRSRANRFFSIFMISVSLWLFAGIVYFTHCGAAVLLLPLQICIGSFFGVLFYFFSRAFIDEHFRVNPLESLLVVPAVCVALYYAMVLLWPGPLPGFERDFTIVDGRVHREPTRMYFLYSINMLAGIAAAVVVLIQGYRRELDASRRRRILIILVSIILGASGIYILSNILTLAGLSGYEHFSLIPHLASIVIVSFTILGDRAWTIEHLLDIIKRRNLEIESELETARLLQMRLLPEEGRTTAGCEVHSAYIPVDKVGGDFFDYGEWNGVPAFFIADVSGHGLPGAFLATVTKMALDGIGDRSETGAVLMELNKVICRATVRQNFVTAFYCVIDRDRGRMRYSSAGHPTQILCRRRGGECVELDAMGSPLGWFTDLSIGENEVAVEAGDRLVLYTDGVVECRNGEGDMFGEGRFLDFIASHVNDPPRSFLEALLNEIRIHSGAEAFGDDITCLVVDIQ